jgi:drug/metabolite transporter (DMT)-like permease
MSDLHLHGAGRAGYSSVAIPVAALLLSTLFEDLQWQMMMVIGSICVFSGTC